MAATIRHIVVEGFSAIEVRNECLRAVIIPELGGRVWQLEDVIRGRQWIWHREGTPLKRARLGAVYDDVWAGGWEELFPNDAPTLFEKRELADHGEWWTLSWDIKEIVEGTTVRIGLEAVSSTVKAKCEKEFELNEGSNKLLVRYRIQSQEVEPFHFLFKQHLPVLITRNCRLSLPGGMVTEVDPAFSTTMRGPGPHTWPYAGEENSGVDMSIIPDKSAKSKEFVYVEDLPQPWCGVEDLGVQAAIRMEYDPVKFPYVWLFLTYGGWRGLYTAVLEPCTNMPKDLRTAVDLGQSTQLQPGEIFETKVSVTLEGLVERNR